MNKYNEKWSIIGSPTHQKPNSHRKHIPTTNDLFKYNPDIYPKKPSKTHSKSIQNLLQNQNLNLLLNYPGKIKIDRNGDARLMPFSLNSNNPEMRENFWAFPGSERGVAVDPDLKLISKKHQELDTNPKNGSSNKLHFG